MSDHCDCRSLPNPGGVRGWRLVAFVVATVWVGVAWADAPVGIDRARQAVRDAEAARITTIDRVAPTVVAVFGERAEGGGSGVVIDPDGFALTNFHVVQAAGDEGWAGLSDGKRYRWKLIGIDPGGDLAMIRLTGRDRFDYAPLGDSDQVRVGAWAMAMGNPFVLSEDYQPTVTLGIVSGTERYQPGTGPKKTLLVYGNCIQIDSSINPGNSGGPLFNMRGELIGINGRGSFEERGRVNVGLGYAISINQAKNFIADLLATKVCEHATLDVTFATRGERVVCDAIDVGRKPAIVEAGLKLGDELVEFDGAPIRSVNQYTNLISTLPADWPVEVAWRRYDQVFRATIRTAALDYGQIQRRPRVTRRIPSQPNEEPKEDGSKPEEGEDEQPAQNESEQAEPAPDAQPAEDAEAGSGDDASPAEEESDRDNEAEGEDAGEPEQPEAPDVRVTRSGPVQQGQVSNLDLNHEHAAMLVDRWQARMNQRQTVEAQASMNVLAGQLVKIVADQGSAGFDKFTLEGGDRIDGRRAYRLLLVDTQANRYRVWLSVFEEDRATFGLTLIRAESDGLDSAPLKQPDADEEQGEEDRSEAGDGIEGATDSGMESRSDAMESSVRMRADVQSTERVIYETRDAHRTAATFTGRDLTRGTVEDLHSFSRFAHLAASPRRWGTPRAMLNWLDSDTPAESEPTPPPAESLEESPTTPTTPTAPTAKPTPEATADPDPLPDHGDPFASAIAVAQARCVKIIGAGIGREHGYATGILVSPYGDILTADGLYLQGRTIRVVMPDGRLHLADVVRRDTTMRLAMIKIDTVTPNYFAVSAMPLAQPGDWTIAVANPFKVASQDEPMSVNLGVMSMRAELDTRRRRQDFDIEGEIMLIDAITSNPGSPGGAVMTADGQLAGMIGKILESQATGTRLNYAVPNDTLRRFIDGKPLTDPTPEPTAVANDGQAEGEPYLGLRLFRMSGRRAPAYIDRVVRDSPAEKAGLQKDDLVMAIGDEIVRNIKDCDRLIEDLKPGQQVVVLIKRDREILQTTITVGVLEEEE